jgi:iron-sulfur cluster repair protein YtfE (RIC family)
MATFGNLQTDVEPIAGLVRDHLEVHGLVTATREAIEAALGDVSNNALAVQALEGVRDLSAYLSEDLVIHIAKEEDVLFPALRGVAAEFPKMLDEMVEQHDEIRLRKSNLDRALAHMDESHDDVQSAALGVARALAGAGGPAADSLAEVHDAVKRLDWIMQGHFGDEEDDLFPPALDLLPRERFAELARQAAALDL